MGIYSNNTCSHSCNKWSGGNQCVTPLDYAAPPFLLLLAHYSVLFIRSHHRRPHASINPTTRIKLTVSDSRTSKHGGPTKTIASATKSRPPPNYINNQYCGNMNRTANLSTDCKYTASCCMHCCRCDCDYTAWSRPGQGQINTTHIHDLLKTTIYTQVHNHTIISYHICTIINTRMYCDTIPATSWSPP